MVSFRKETNAERTNAGRTLEEHWRNDLDCSEKLKTNNTNRGIEVVKRSFFYWTSKFLKDFDNDDRFLLNERFFKTNFKINDWFFPEQTIFLDKLLRTNDFMNEQFFEQTILLNERFYWMNDFPEKTNEIDGKWTIIIKTNKINFLTIEKKKCVFTKDE